MINIKALPELSSVCNSDPGPAVCPFAVTESLYRLQTSAHMENKIQNSLIFHQKLVQQSSPTCYVIRKLFLLQLRVIVFLSLRVFRGFTLYEWMKKVVGVLSTVINNVSVCWWISSQDNKSSAFRNSLFCSHWLPWMYYKNWMLHFKMAPIHFIRNCLLNA